MKLTHSCPTLWPHGLYCAKLFCPWNFPGKGVFWPRDQTWVSHIAGKFFYHLSHQGNLLSVIWGWKYLSHLHTWKLYFLITTILFTGLPWWLSGKESPCQCRRCGFDPWSGISPAEENSNLLQYSYPRNPMNRGAWWAIVHGVTKESGMTEQLNNNNDKCWFQ